MVHGPIREDFDAAALQGIQIDIGTILVFDVFESVCKLTQDLWENVVLLAIAGKYHGSFFLCGPVSRQYWRRSLQFIYVLGFLVEEIVFHGTGTSLLGVFLIFIFNLALRHDAGFLASSQSEAIEKRGLICAEVSNE